jgi:hypothetical protein
LLTVPFETLNMQVCAAWNIEYNTTGCEVVWFKL